MNNLCIIPARGGSKRIPLKNIKDFLGKPIIAYSIEAAQTSGLFNEIMVSTDNEEIAEVGRKYGAKVPFLRSSTNADDSAGLAQVIEEVVECYNIKNMFFERVCCVLPTAPLVTPKLLIDGLEILKNNNFDSVRVIQEFPYPIQRAYKNKDGYLTYLHPDYSKSRSQDLDKYYHDAGVFYWINHKSIGNNQKLGGLIVTEMDAHDIDTDEDWKVAEFKYLYKNK